MSWTCRKKKTSYRMLIENPVGNRPFIILKIKLSNNTETDLNK